MKEDNISSNGSNDPNVPTPKVPTGVLGGNADGGAVGISPRRSADADEAAIAALGRQIEQRQRREPQPLTVSQSLVGAINNRFSPTAQKTRLVDEMRELVNDPQTADWLYGYAADLLLVHGQGSGPNAGQIFARMQGVLAEFREFRELRRRNGQPQGPRGMVFNARVMEIAAVYGIPTPKQLKRQREAERRRQRGH